MAGAFNSTKESQRRSRVAARKVDEAGGLVRDSESIRQQVDDLLDDRQDEFDRQYRQNEGDLQDLNDQVLRLDDKIIDLNEAVSLQFIALYLLGSTKTCISHNS